MKSKYQEKIWFDYVQLDKENYSTIRLIEKNIDSREKIKQPLIETLIHYYIPSEIIEFYLEEDEYMGELERIINDYLPRRENDNIRKGDFAEIISSEHLIQNYKYYFPYIKLQNKTSIKSSNHGDDLFGFKFSKNKKINEICIGEVKFLAKFTNYIFKNAHEQLKESYTPNPKSLKNVVNYVVKQKDEYSREYKKLLSTKILSQIKISNWIFCVTEKSHDTIDIHGETEFLDNLTLVSIYLPDIIPFIHEIYDLSSGFYNEK